MARPLKYNWGAIEKAYIQGAEVKDICKQYNITKKTLQNKIYEKKWEMTGNINSDVNEFKAVLGKVTEAALNNPETTDIYIEKITTVLEDNKLIRNNRKLASAVHAILGQEIKNKKVNVNNVRNVTGALKDIESMANPQSNRTEVNVNTQTNVQQTYKTLDDFYDDQ